MRKNTIIFDKPAFHQTCFGRTVIGGMAAILTAGAYWAFVPEEKRPVVQTPVAVKQTIARQPIKPFDPVYDQITTQPASAPAVALPQPALLPDQPGTTSSITLYPDVQSALQELQRDDLECTVRRFTTRPTADGLVASVHNYAEMRQNNSSQSCAPDKLRAAFEQAAEATMNRRTVESLLDLETTSDMVYPPVLIQVTATQRGVENSAPLASHILVCQQEGTMRRNDLRFHCHLGPS